MTIASATSRVSYVGDGSTTTFAIPFYFQANGDIVCQLQNSSGASTTLVLGTDYTLSGAGVSTGGSLTFTTAPTSTTGAVISIYRDPPVTQTTSYNNSDPFPAKSHENALDKATMIAQRTRDMITRTVQIPDSDPSTLDMHMPTVANRKNKLLGFDSSGQPIAMLGPTFAGGTDIGAAVVSTQTVAAVTTFASSVLYIITGGLSAVGDGGSATYKRGTGAGQFTDGGGVTWVPFSTGATATLPEGRLTLASGSPVMAASVTAATTLYYAPFIGKNVPITTSGVTRLYPFTSGATDAVGLSLVLGSNWAANTNYDVFIALNGGVVTLATGPDWSAGAVAGSNAVGASTRGTGAGSTDLQLYNGFLTNKNQITLRNSNASTFVAAANEALYVGTFRTGSAGQISFTFGTQGVAGTFNLWNCYNQVLVASTSSDSTASWTYSSATVRQANASAVNQFNFITGLASGGISVDVVQNVRPAASASASGRVGVALNSTTVFDARAQVGNPAAGTMDGSANVHVNYKPQLGANYIAQTEAGDGTTTATFFGQNFQQISVSLWM